MLRAIVVQVERLSTLHKLRACGGDVAQNSVAVVALQFCFKMRQSKQQAGVTHSEIIRRFRVGVNHQITTDGLRRGYQFGGGRASAGGEEQGEND